MGGALQTSSRHGVPPATALPAALLGAAGPPAVVPGRHPGAAGWASLALTHTLWPERLLKLPLEGLREFLQDTLAQPWALDDEGVLRHLRASMAQLRKMQCDLPPPGGLRAPSPPDSPSWGSTQWTEPPGPSSSPPSLSSSAPTLGNPGQGGAPGRSLQGPGISSLEGGGQGQARVDTGSHEPTWAQPAGDSLLETLMQSASLQRAPRSSPRCPWAWSKGPRHPGPSSLLRALRRSPEWTGRPPQVQPPNVSSWDTFPARPSSRPRSRCCGRERPRSQRLHP